MKAVMPTGGDCLSPFARLISGKPLPAEEEDIDVACERQRVYEGKAENDLLRILDLSKVKSIFPLFRPCFFVQLLSHYSTLQYISLGDE